jgi:hypothetical protein
MQKIVGFTDEVGDSSNRSSTGLRECDEEQEDHEDNGNGDEDDDEEIEKLEEEGEKWEKKKKATKNGENVDTGEEKFVVYRAWKTKNDAIRERNFEKKSVEENMKLFDAEMGRILKREQETEEARRWDVVKQDKAEKREERKEKAKVTAEKKKKEQEEKYEKEVEDRLLGLEKGLKDGGKEKEKVKEKEKAKEKESENGCDIEDLPLSLPLHEALSGYTISFQQTMMHRDFLRKKMEIMAMGKDKTVGDFIETREYAHYKKEIQETKESKGKGRRREWRRGRIKRS